MRALSPDRYPGEVTHARWQLWQVRSAGYPPVYDLRPDLLPPMSRLGRTEVRGLPERGETAKGSPGPGTTAVPETLPSSALAQVGRPAALVLALVGKAGEHELPGGGPLGDPQHHDPHHARHQPEADGAEGVDP